MRYLGRVRDQSVRQVGKQSCDLPFLTNFFFREKMKGEFALTQTITVIPLWKSTTFHF